MQAVGTDQRSGAAALPDRPLLPAWVPVLRRSVTELQIGLDPQSGVILAGAPAGLQQVLGLLDGVRTVQQITALALGHGVDADLLGQVLRALQAAGLLAPTAPPAARLRIRLLGAGVLGRAVAVALADAGVGELILVDADPVDPLLYPRSGVATDQADALRAYLIGHARGRSADPIGARTRVEVARHWTKPEAPPPDLTVIATATAEPDRAIVGPRVRPGRSPCLGCLDQVRTDADRDWPALLAQLCRRPMPVEPLLAGWAAGTAVTQLLTELNGGAPATLAGTFELTAADTEPRLRQWPMHPICGCAWHG